MIEDNVKSETVLRLKRIEGQIRGIQKMIQSDRLHNNIVVQLSAVGKAINSVCLILLKGHIEMSVEDMIMRGNSEDKIDGLVNTLFGIVK